MILERPDVRSLGQYQRSPTIDKLPKPAVCQPTEVLRPRSHVPVLMTQSANSSATSQSPGEARTGLWVMPAGQLSLIQMEGRTDWDG
jgi:hypothetical protein